MKVTVIISFEVEADTILGAIVLVGSCLDFAKNYKTESIKEVEFVDAKEIEHAEF